MTNLHLLTDYMCMCVFKRIQVYKKCNAAGILRGQKTLQS